MRGGESLSKRPGGSNDANAEVLSYCVLLAGLLEISVATIVYARRTQMNN